MHARVAAVGAMLAAAIMIAGCSSSSTGAGHPSAGTPDTTTASTTSSAPAGTTTTPTTIAPPGTMPPTSAVPADWAKHVNFASQPHPGLNCTPAGLGGKVEVDGVLSSDVTGDGAPDAIVTVDCDHSASEWPDLVYVYSDASGKPAVIGTLITAKDSTFVPKITARGHTITAHLLTWSPYAAGCCPDLNYTQTFSWTGRAFDPSARHDVLLPCGDSAFTVSTADRNGAAGHGSLVLRMRNRLSEACTVYGYPGLDAVNGSGHVLAHARRTLRGMAGGAPSLRTVRVAAGATVSALVEWSTVPTGNGHCATSASIEVTPPNTTDTQSKRISLSTCELQVHPTVSGLTGNA